MNIAIRKIKHSVKYVTSENTALIKKMHQHTDSKIVMSVLLGLMISPSINASTIENAVDASGAGTIPIIYGDHTTNAFVTSTGTGSYSFEGVADDDLRIVVSGQSRGFDPRIELRDPTGTVLQSTTCSASSTSYCSVALDQPLDSSGTHYINVTDSGTDNNGSYTMHFDLFPPSDPLGNNWDGIKYNSLVSDSLGHLGDHDMFAFWGGSGTGISVNVDGLSLGMDSHLTIWGPSGGASLYDSSCGASSTSTCSVRGSIDLIEDGLYFIALYDHGLDNSGNYDLQLACTYGPCPVDVTPPPVPVPAAVWLFSSGLLGLIGIARRSKTA